MAKRKNKKVEEIEVNEPVEVNIAGCFTCGKTFNTNTKQRIEYYKEIEQKTNEKYIYFKKENGEIAITKASKFKPTRNTEFAFVSEFGNISTSNVVEIAK